MLRKVVKASKEISKVFKILQQTLTVIKLYLSTYLFLLWFKIQKYWEIKWTRINENQFFFLFGTSRLTALFSGSWRTHLFLTKLWIVMRQSNYLWLSWKLFFVFLAIISFQLDRLLLWYLSIFFLLDCIAQSVIN